MQSAPKRRADSIQRKDNTDSEGPGLAICIEERRSVDRALQFQDPRCSEAIPRDVDRIPSRPRELLREPARLPRYDLFGEHPAATHQEYSAVGRMTDEAADLKGGGLC